jgi:hypothetical protein
MGHLERWTEVISGEFNSQGISNTVWMFTTMGTKTGVRTVGGDIRGVQLSRGCKRPAIDMWVHEHARQNKEQDRDCEQWSLTGLQRRIFCGVQVATWWDLDEVSAS